MKPDFSEDSFEQLGSCRLCLKVGFEYSLSLHSVPTLVLREMAGEGSSMWKIAWSETPGPLQRALADVDATTPGVFANLVEDEIDRFAAQIGDPRASESFIMDWADHIRRLRNAARGGPAALDHAFLVDATVAELIAERATREAKRRRLQETEEAMTGPQKPSHPPAPPKVQRWPGRFRQAMADASTKTAKADAEEKERARWVDQMVWLLEGQIRRQSTLRRQQPTHRKHFVGQLRESEQRLSGRR